MKNYILKGLYIHVYMYTFLNEYNITKDNFVINSFGAKGNIELFANNADSGESARNELSHLKPALFGCEL